MIFKPKLLTGTLVFLCTCFSGANLFAQTRADSTWPMFHHDPHHTGLSPLTGVMDTCSFYWSYSTNSSVYSSPALGDIDEDGKFEVVIGSNDNNVYALNGEDGSFLWSYTTGNDVHSSPALGDIDEDGKLEVVIGSCDNNVYALNGEDGSFLWSYTTGNDVTSSPALGDIDGDGKLEVVVGSNDNNVYALNGEDGSFLWSYTTGSYVNSPALGDIDEDGKLEVVVGSNDWKVYALGRIAPDIALSDSIHNFGDVAVSDSSDWTFKIFNFGNSTLDVDSLKNNQVVFQTVSPSFPQNILPNDSIDVTVRFTPDTIKTYQDTLSIFSNDPDEPIVYIYLTGNGIDATPPVIDSTTIWTDTSYAGPFPVYTKVTDNTGVETVLLYFKRMEDPVFFSIEMLEGANNWYYEAIPEAFLPDDTIKYYIYASDIAQPPNESTDPPGAPGNYYWFIANFTGIEELRITPEYFSFGLKSSPARGKVVFNLIIPEAAEITLKIYDVSGRLIHTPMKGRKPAGIYEISWTSGESAGVYFYCLESFWGRKIGKFILIR